ncbi:MAG: hypothetical protein HY685_02845 [Chloroflexi bacterium]|nr:hypothetical protein [Chloroflexota bacterium]
MTTQQPVPADQKCPGCGAFVFYEGHTELRRPTALIPHRFHCHRCGRVYTVQSTSHHPPKIPLKPRHEVKGLVQQAEASAEPAAQPPQGIVVATPQPPSEEAPEKQPEEQRGS